MSLPPDHPLPRRSPPSFRPSFTLALLYLVVFFALYAFLMILPEILTILRDVPPGPEQQQIAEDVTRRVFASRMPYAVILALASLGLGAYLEVLPGLRRP